MSIEQLIATISAEEIANTQESAQTHYETDNLEGNQMIMIAFD